MYRRFRDLTPVTAVIINHLTERIDRYNLFSYIRLQNVDIDLEKPKTKDIVELGLPDGTFLIARDKNNYRGYVIDLKKGFDNALTIRLIYNNRVICAKITNNILHLTGIRDLNDNREVVEIILREIRSLQSDLDYIAQNFEEAERVLFYLAENLKDEEIDEVQENEEQYLIDNENHEVKINYTLKDISSIDEFCPSHLDQRIFDFYMNYIGEFGDYNTLISELRATLSGIVIANPDIELHHEEIVMINYDFNFNTDIRLAVFAQKLRENGFSVRFNNLVENRIVAHYKSQMEFRKKEHVPKVTFQVHSGGFVKQSNPSSVDAEFTYNLFTDIFFKYFNEICL